VDGLRDRERQRDEVQRHLGMTFRGADERDGTPVPVDLVPRVIAAEDWEFLRPGLIQRVRALEAFLRDAYGERAAVRDGVLPAWVIDESPGRRAAGRRVPAGMVRCLVAGIDLIRDGAGRWAVLGDNLSAPSGIGLAMATRWVAARVLPDLVRAAHPVPPARAVAQLRTALARSSADIALVTPGPADPDFFEHQLLAGAMGIPLVRPADMTTADGGVRTAGGEPLRVLYRRIDEDDLFQAAGADQSPLGPGLADAIERGDLVLANAPGNELAEDRRLYPFVPHLIEYYLGEAALLPDIATLLCRDPRQRAEALDRLNELVIRPISGADLVIGPDATPAELAEVRARILAEPDRWIAHEYAKLSTHPTLTGGRLEPRPVDLRAFVCQGPEPVVMPIAWTRMAPPGGKIVDSSPRGGSKDTWLPQ
jgi:carboxylate-amine ligase